MGILTQSQKSLFDSNIFDRAIRSAHPVEMVDFFNGMCGSDRSFEKVFEAHRIFHHPARRRITPYNSSDAGLTATMLLLLLLLNDSAWHIVFSASQQRVPSSDGSCAFYRRPFFLQHRCCCCCCALFGDSRRSPTPQSRR